MVDSTKGRSTSNRNRNGTESVFRALSGRGRRTVTHLKDNKEAIRDFTTHVLIPVYDGGKNNCNRYRLGYNRLSGLDIEAQEVFPWERSYWRRHRRSSPDRRALSAMPKRHIRSWVLSAFACWLTLLASADDFNLARVVLPSPTSDSEGLLPLDDPNTDFTESSESPVPTTTYRGRGALTSSVGQRLMGADLASPSAAPAPGRPPRNCSIAPLRC